MTLHNPRKYNRRSIRLKRYDYSQKGAYFVTVCTRDKECVFGEIIDGEMRLNGTGDMVRRWWCELKNKFENVELDEHVVMPNHFHGIIIIVGADLRVCPSMGKRIGLPLHRMVQWFKTMTTNEYIRAIKQSLSVPNNKRLWQRNYYEHIVRNEEDLNEIREYIITNPLKWATDSENPNSFL